MPTSHWVYEKVLPQKWTPHRGQSSISWLKCLTTLMDCTNQLSTPKSIPRGLAPLPLSHVTFLLGDRINIQNIIDSLLIACLIIFSTCLAVLTDLSHQYVLEAWKCNTYNHCVLSYNWIKTWYINPILTRVRKINMIRK